MKKIVISKKYYFDYGFPLIITTIIIHVLYGLSILNPNNIKWLMSVYHDWGTHYLGWAYYRNEPWSFPLGEVKNYYYPVGTNVGFTDSAPLFAFIFKLFSAVLPKQFQYLGMLLFLCHFLVAYYGIKIFKLYKVNNFLIILGVILLTSNPVLVFRGIHPALSTHFLILASIYNYLRTSNINTANKINYNQMLIFFLAVTINPYIAMMVAGFNIIIPLKNYIFEKSISFKKLIYFPLVSFLSGLFFWIIFGMINIGNSTSTNLASSDNFRQYSFNLNSFFNSYGHFSKFFPDLGMIDEKQYEGFAYFGAGIFLLIFLTTIYYLVAFRKNKGTLSNKKKFYPLYFLCFGLFIFSLSCQISFGKKVLFEYPIPNIIEKLGFTFRASGRFVWPLYYLILIFSLLLFFKTKINSKVKTFLLLTIVFIQLYDIQVLITKNNLTSGDFHTKLTDNKWISVFKNFDEIITYPPFETTLGYNMDYQDLCFLALKANKPITNGYVARVNNADKDKYRDNLLRDIKTGNIKEGQLFITTSKYLDDFDVLIFRRKVSISKINDFFFIYSQKKQNLVDRIVNSNESEKAYIKTILNQYKNQGSINYNLKKIDIKETGNIKYYIDNFNYENDVLQMRGWAFIKNTKTNLGDSIFLTLTRNKLSYIIPLKLEKRPDITSANSNGYLDDAGFNSVLFTDALEKGNYSMGILVKDIKGNLIYTKTERVLNKTSEKVVFKEEITSYNDLPVVNQKNIKFNLSLFSPIKSDGTGLKFFENALTKYQPLNLKKGNYKIYVQGISYPAKPLKGKNAHFEIKLNGVKKGDFYLSNTSQMDKKMVEFNLEKNQIVTLELIYDNDEMLNNIDRNGIITEIEIIKE